MWWLKDSLIWIKHLTVHRAFKRIQNVFNMCGYYLIVYCIVDSLSLSIYIHYLLCLNVSFHQPSSSKAQLKGIEWTKIIGFFACFECFRPGNRPGTKWRAAESGHFSAGPSFKRWEGAIGRLGGRHIESWMFMVWSLSVLNFVEDFSFGLTWVDSHSLKSTHWSN